MWNIEPKEIKKAKSFKNMAHYILNKKKDNIDKEIQLRTAINRYYYYVFLYLRENIAKIDNREEIKKILYPNDKDREDEYKPKIGPHTFLIIYLKHVINMSKKHSLGSYKMYSASSILSDLFNKRKLADYDLSEDVNRIILNDVEEEVKKLEECFKDIFEIIAQLQGMNKLPKCDNYFE